VGPASSPNPIIDPGDPETLTGKDGDLSGRLASLPGPLQEYEDLIISTGGGPIAAAYGAYSESTINYYDKDGGAQTMTARTGFRSKGEFTLEWRTDLPQPLSEEEKSAWMQKFLLVITKRKTPADPAHPDGEVITAHTLTSADIGTPIEVDSGNPVTEPDVQTVVTVDLLRIDLAIDANRDGTIASGETASQAKPLRFWINNDSDTGETDKEEEGSTPDHQDGSISSIRDLEDFQMLKVSIPDDIFTQVIHGDAEIGLKWKNISGTAPSVKVYRVSDEIDEIKDYIWNKSKATSQAGGKPYTDSIATVSGSSTAWLPPEAIKRYEGEDEHPYLLFEGAAKGTGQLCLVIKMSSGASETEGPGVWLKLMDVEEMFANAMGTPPKPYPNPPDYCPDEPSRPATGYRDIYWTGRGQYQKPPDETDEAIIHVHGWKMADPDRRTFSESFFKRLWWKGYKGLFCSFSWPTYNEEDNTLGIPAHYNASEYVAWKYGPGLQAYVNSISKSSKHLAAHSMGNVVVASALLNGLNINNYVAMEAAIPSGCYDDATNNFAPFASAEQLLPTPDDAVPALGYRKLMDGISTGGFHNFHNKNDFALSEGNYGPIAANWESNQIAYKPNGTLGYSYAPNAVNVAKIRIIQQVTTGVYVSRDVADHHEAMAFVARPRSRALGSQETAGFTNFDLSSLAKYPFGRDRTEHSGQYQRPIQKTHMFFNSLLDSMDVEFNFLEDSTL